MKSSDRFKTAKRTLIIDSFMTRFIKVGGIALIAAVFAIFVFIFWQILPLFKGAEVKEAWSLSLDPSKDYVAVGADEWNELPFVVDSQGKIFFIDTINKKSLVEVNPASGSQKFFSTFRYKPAKQNIVFGSNDGYFSIVDIGYEAEYRNNKRVVTQNAKASPYLPIGRPGGKIIRIDYGDSGADKLVAVIQQGEKGYEVHALPLYQERSLFGAGEMSVGKNFLLTGSFSGEPVDVLVNSAADNVLVRCKDGQMHYFHKSADTFEKVQSFYPFGDVAGKEVASAEYLFGDVSIVFVNPDGKNRVYSLFHAKGESQRLFHLTKEFASLPGAPSFYARSLRNKVFLVGSGDYASLRYSTTETIRWEKKLPFTPISGIIGGKYDSLLFLDKEKKVHLFKLRDPHPEASFKAFFTKIWYEGSPEPKFEWQSTGGSDEFEPKLSLVPLIIGTLKGTLYAMLFALPIAILAAIYTSQFLNPKIRAVAKPTMEIMASLPSVVLGFLAALWLAPLIETRVPSILVIILLLPICACAIGMALPLLPNAHKKIIKPGSEFLFFVPVLILVVWAGWHLGPILEKFLFVATEPSTGAKIADFRLWWPEVTGASFEQRNSLVVGFIMGFAVIPLIFTITEDALSNVPNYLRSGSLALGASRWQTAIHVVLPTASAGIFSALMIGLGRAIGETMIVVMATGNTPIMDLNIFSGMRTLSANIAVELPEAPHHGTLYRTLFLGAMVLFLATFTINTIAELLRQKLRDKYKTV